MFAELCNGTADIELVRRRYNGFMLSKVGRDLAHRPDRLTCLPSGVCEVWRSGTSGRMNIDNR